MSIMRQLARGLSALFHPRKADSEIDEDIRHYADQVEAEHIAAGMTPSAAVRAARREVGSATAVRESVRSSGWEHSVETLMQDIRYTIRGLRNSPVFTFTAVATLAIGLGASTAVFSAASPILLQPLPFPHASRLVSIMDRNTTGDASPPTLGTYVEVRDRSRTLEAIAAADRWQPSLLGTSDPERLEAQRVTAGYFNAFGASPLIGRAFTEAETRPGGPALVVLSAALWKRRFSSDPAIVGKSIELNAAPYLVIGVMPPQFANVLAPKAQLWAPLQDPVSGELSTRAWGHHYQVVGRLAPGATTDALNRELLQIGRTPMPAYPRPQWAAMATGLRVTSLQDQVTGTVRTALFAIIGAVILLLAIASVNVTNLLLARGARRRSELAMRMALGAGRGRLLRQLLTESVVLALAGGVVGLLVAKFALGALLAASPPGLPRAEAIHLDVGAFGFSLALTTIVGLLVGLAPAFRTLRADVSVGLRPGTRRATAGRESARGTLVIVEVALALILLVGAGLLFRSVRRLVSVPPGFDASQVMTIQLVMPGREFSSDTVRLQFLNRALDAVQHIPGVASAGFTSQLPLSGEVDGYGLEVQSLPDTRNGQAGSALRYAVAPGYLTAMRIPLKRGRLLNATDLPGGSEAVLINESLARRLFQDRDPIGERIRFGPEMNGSDHWDYIVGVVGDVRQYSLAVPAPDAFYVTEGQWAWVDNAVTLVVRASGNPGALVPSLKRAIWSIDTDIPIQRIEAMDEFVTASAGQRRFVLLAIEAFALTALLLAAVGLYGVISGEVNERTREIGIRTALGAAPSSVVRGVVRRALVLAAAGGAIGVLGAIAATRLLASMLFGISRADPVSYLAGLGTLAIVAMAAAWGPARRAARVDPTIALRAE